MHRGSSRDFFVGFGKRESYQPTAQLGNAHEQRALQIIPLNHSGHGIYLADVRFLNVDCRSTSTYIRASGELQMSEEAKAFEVSVIVFREDSSFTALALEMDVRGYGSTPQAAIQDAITMLQAQVSFAVQRGHPESVWRRAEDKYWRMFEEVRRNQFVSEVSGSKAATDRLANMVPLPLLELKQGSAWIAARA